MGLVSFLSLKLPITCFGITKCVQQRTYSYLDHIDSVAVSKGYYLGASPQSSTHWEGGVDDAEGRWDDGDGGYEWKERYLNEKRAMAKNYIFNVDKRVPIHNSVRIAARRSRERLLRSIEDSHDSYAQDSPAKALAEVLHITNDQVLFGNADTTLGFSQGDSAADAIKAVERELNDLLENEELLDVLCELPESSVKQISSVFNNSNLELNRHYDRKLDEMLREWCKLRKESSEVQSYASMPPGERTEWSAWYLRDIRSNNKDNDR